MRPHLVLAHLGGDDGGRRIQLASQLGDNELGDDLVALLVLGHVRVVERVAGAPRVDIGDPLVVARGGAVLLEHLEHAGDDALQVAHNGHIGIADLPDLRRVDVDVHDLRVGGELGDAPGDPVGKARAGGDDEAGLGHGHVRVLRPVHAHRPQIQRMARGHAALAHEGDDGGNAHLVHEGHNLVGRL